MVALMKLGHCDGNFVKHFAFGVSNFNRPADPALCYAVSLDSPQSFLGLPIPELSHQEIANRQWRDRCQRDYRRRQMRPV
jgi:hypothetical protein